MKKIVFLICCLLIVLLAACAESSSPSLTPAPMQTQETLSTPLPTAVPTTAPDFANFDFSGKWCVSMVLDAAGMALSELEIQQLGADFTLELAENGVYFVYDANGAPRGQGTYSVIENIMTLSANGEEMRYTIQDAETFYITSADNSVTYMTRCPDEVIEENADTENADTENADTENADTENADAAETETPA